MYELRSHWLVFRRRAQRAHRAVYWRVQSQTTFTPRSRGRRMSLNPTLSQNPLAVREDDDGTIRFYDDREYAEGTSTRWLTSDTWVDVKEHN